MDVSSGITIQDVEQAQVRNRPTVRFTPMLVNDDFNEQYGRKFYFKAESMQKTGAFKIRGVLNAIRKRQEQSIPIKGLVSHSSGNHGRALAWVSRDLGVPCTIVCPTTVPESKVKVIKELGADVLYCRPTLQDRLNTVQQLVEEKDYTYIPTCEHYDVIAGQGTIGLEILDQVPEVDAILVPVSGGGMAAGICVAVKSLKPSVKVFAVEPEGKELQRCLQAGRRLWQHEGRFLDTVADGMRMEQLGLKPWSILVNMAEKTVFTVTDEQALRGMSSAFHNLKIVVEPSAGTAIAAAMSDQLVSLDPALKHVVVVLCGGNVDTDLFLKQLQEC